MARGHGPESMDKALDGLLKMMMGGGAQARTVGWHCAVV